MVGADHAGYTNRFYELAKLVPHLVTPKVKRVTRYINGLPSQILGMLQDTQPATIQAAILTARILTDEAVYSGTLAKAGEKRKERDEASKSESVGKDKKKAKGGRGFVAAVPPRRENRNFPKCVRCKGFHAEKGPCLVCYNCQRPSHMARECRAPVGHAEPIRAVRLRNWQRACYECGSLDHLRPNSLQWNRERKSIGNQLALEGNRTPEAIYQAIGRACKRGMFFISTKFATLLNVKSSIANPGYVIEVANGRKEEVDRIFHGCRLELGDSMFHIDLIPLGQGSFDVIVRMDWLKTKTLMSTKANEPTLSDIPIVRDFEDVFLNDLSRLPPQRQVEFRIDLIPRATPVAKSPYRLAPLERQELWKILWFIVMRQTKDLDVFLCKGIRTKSVIYTDHKSLQHIFNQKELNMRQRRWLEMFSDYECEIKYHPGKANVATDALSRKERVKPRRVRAMAVTIQSGVKGLILAAQGEAFKDENVMAEGLNGTNQQMEKRENRSLYYMDRIWVPLVGGVRTKIMDEAHKTRYSVHPRADKMYYDLRDMYWWPGMKKEIAIYVSKCLTCAKVKAEHQRPSGLLQQPEIPEWKWEKIAMDFITKLPRSSSGHDAIWVIVDRLTKSAHFLEIREDYSMEKLARLYIDEIVARHGVPTSIISDRDGRFTSRFWQTMQKALGTGVRLVTAYHRRRKTNAKCTIQTLEDMLRACVIDFGGSWNIHLSLAEFSYNNSYHSSIRCAPFEALYGRKCRSPVLWAEIGDSRLIGPEMVQEMTDKVVVIRDRLKAARDRQKSYADNRRKPLEFQVSDHVMLKVSQ
ncbi:putative reverse transcriptase domain-containing protein [Tanacetum coccineum]